MEGVCDMFHEEEALQDEEWKLKPIEFKLDEK